MAKAKENQAQTKVEAKLMQVKAPALKPVRKPKVEKVAKRVTGVLIYVATTTYNNWRQVVNKLLNGEDETKIARLVKFSAEEVEQTDSINWAGHIATTPENVEEVIALLNGYVEMYPTDKYDSLFTMLETFREVQPTPRVRKPKAENAENTTEA